MAGHVVHRSQAKQLWPWCVATIADHRVLATDMMPHGLAAVL
jgi:hypothetical protein